MAAMNEWDESDVLDDWLSATGCTGAAAAEVRRLLAHVAEPDGSAWTDVKWAAKAASGARG